VSLILEALKKLEREKQTPDRGFLVMAQVPWAGEGRRGRALLVLGLLVATGAAGAFFLWRHGPGTKATAPAEAVAPPPTAPAPALPASVAPPPRLSTGPGPSIALPPRFVPPPSRTGSPAPPRAAAATPAAAPAAAPGQTAAPPALAPSNELRLEAVSEQEGVAVAVINGQLVREGDHIGNAVVLRIGVQEVEVEVDGRRTVLRF
jgi:hypothetical protein